MTDNYQIDKNSKLFQKFLNLKNNKASEPPLERIPQSESVVIPKKEPVQRVEEVREQINDDFGKTYGKMQLHMTISDIEEAAEMSVRDDGPVKMKKQVIRQPEPIKEKLKTDYDSYEAQTNVDYQTVRIEESTDNKPYESLKPERMRERRTRDFSDRNKGRNDGKMERSFRNDSAMPSQKQSVADIAVKEDYKRQKENLMSHNEEEELPIKQENMFTLGSREGEYKKKYEKLYEKYEELKEKVQKERKQRQQELNDRQAENELIKEKYFEVRSNEDTLTGELKRTKEKLQSENMIRTKFEEEVKELNFKIEELQDMLDGKEANLKKKIDETNHWKSQLQQYKGQLKLLNAEIQKLQDRCQFLQSQNKMVKKDIQNKEGLIEELRKNINNLIEENNIAKDQIYKMTIKAYHYQQENQILKGDLMRRDREQPQMSAIQENYMRSIESLSPKRREFRPERGERAVVEQRQERPQRNDREPVPANNRRREFARERAVTSKPQRQERPIEQREQKKIPQAMDRKSINERRTQPPSGPKQSIISRIQYLQQQLQKRKQLKAMTGKLRRQKIEMQRQLQQLIAKANQ